MVASSLKRSFHIPSTCMFVIVFDRRFSVTLNTQARVLGIAKHRSQTYVRMPLFEPACSALQPSRLGRSALDLFVASSFIISLGVADFDPLCVETLLVQWIAMFRSISESLKRHVLCASRSLDPLPLVIKRTPHPVRRGSAAIRRLTP